LIDFRNGLLLVELAYRHGTREEGVDVELSGLGTLTEEFQDTFYPTHQLGEKTIVMGVHFMHKVVEVVLMALAEVDEGLYSLVGVGGYVLFAAFVDNLRV